MTRKSMLIKKKKKKGSGVINVVKMHKQGCMWAVINCSTVDLLPYKKCKMQIQRGTK